MQLKSVSGGGTKISEFYIKVIGKNNKSFFFKFKIVESADLTHFYVKAVPLDSATSYKTNDVIKCANDYAFKNVVREDEYRNLIVYKFRINSQGLQFMQPYADRYYTQPLAENVWVYLGGVPTSEIRK